MNEFGIRHSTTLPLTRWLCISVAPMLDIDIATMKRTHSMCALWLVLLYETSTRDKKKTTAKLSDSMQYRHFILHTYQVDADGIAFSGLVRLHIRYTMWSTTSPARAITPHQPECCVLPFECMLINKRRRIPGGISRTLCIRRMCPECTLNVCV